MSRFASATITRPMRDGQVFCLVQAQRMPVERCGDCDMLEAVVADDTDTPIAILCRPPLAALLGPEEHRGLLDPDRGW